MKYDTLSDLEAGEVTLLPSPGKTEVEVGEDQGMKDYLVLFGRLYVNGILHMPSSNRLNERFPDLKTRTLEDFLAEAWKGR